MRGVKFAVFEVGVVGADEHAMTPTSTTPSNSDPCAGAGTPARPPMPGWDAIERAFDAVYPGQVPEHVSVGMSWLSDTVTQSPHGLEAISVYDAGDHWHYVTFGLSELYTKDSPDLSRSGWGCELTMRVTKTPGERTPPWWPCYALLRVAKYVWTGPSLRMGDSISTGSPVTGYPSGDGPDTHLTGLLVLPDIGLPDALITPHGTVQLLQLVAITTGEVLALAEGPLCPVVERLTAHHDLLAVDLDRPNTIAT